MSTKKETTKRISITILPSLLEQAKKDAKRNGRSLSNYVCYLLAENASKNIE